MSSKFVDLYPHTRLRQNRVVVESPNVDAGAEVTVFVGLYNSEPYFDDLVRQIEAQTIAHARWLFVDNASADQTWHRITEWAAHSDKDVTLVRNDVNLGATGSIFVNFDLVSTEWATFIHQDDFYLPPHLETLASAARSASADVVGAFSDLGRASSVGEPRGAFPPPIWLVPDMEQPTIFLALLRNHCIPWPALIVRTLVFRQTEAPWHSTAFPDTEITLRLAGRGRFVHIPAETMRYRDSETSESRSIDDRERKAGATVSLFRVFNSDEFASLAMAIAQDDRSSFVAGLRDSIAVRLGHTDRGRLVTLAALERLEQLWDNSEPEGLRLLSGLYGGLGATATSGLLGRMAAAAGNDTPAEPVSYPDDPALMRASSSHQLAGGPRRLYERFGHLVPYPLRRVVATSLIRLVTRGDALNAWRFQWR